MPLPGAVGWIKGNSAQVSKDQGYHSNSLDLRLSTFIRNTGLESSFQVTSLSGSGVRVILAPQNELGAIEGLDREIVRHQRKLPGDDSSVGVLTLGRDQGLRCWGISKVPTKVG